MITLFTFGPYFGLPDASPFVIKAMMLLKFASLEYSEDRGGYVQSLIRRKVKKTLNLQGFGRHMPAERDALAIADIDALATLIGDKAFLLGEKPCGADAMVFAFVASFLAPAFDTPIRTAAERHANLAGHRDRIRRRYFEG